MQTELKSQCKTQSTKSKRLFSWPMNRRNFISTAVITSSGVLATSVATTQYGRMPTVRWKMANFLDKTSNSLILSKAPRMLSERLKEMTGNRFQLEPYDGKKILTEEILKKVSDGKEVECGYSGIYYNSNRYKVLFFGSSIPHGLTPQEQTAWLLYKKDSQQDKKDSQELTYIQKLYPKLGLDVIPFPIAATGNQMGGWFKDEIKTVADFRNKKIRMRIPGLGGDVLREFGVNVAKDSAGAPILPSEIANNLRNNTLQAAEWIGPHDDFVLELHDAEAKYYYYPGWWEPSATFDMLVNIDAWNNLLPHYQEIFKAACWETYTRILAEYNQHNSEYLEKIRKSGIDIIPFSDDILYQTEKTTKGLLSSYKDDLFQEVYNEWNSFKKQIRKWSELSYSAQWLVKSQKSKSL